MSGEWDEEEYDSNKDKPTTNIGRAQHFIASAIFRPESKHTADQRQRLSERRWNDVQGAHYYGMSETNSKIIDETIKSEASSKKRTTERIAPELNAYTTALEGLKKNIEDYPKAKGIGYEKEKEYRDAESVYSRLKVEHNRLNQEYENVKNKPSGLTNRTQWAAALLGKKAVSSALTGERFGESAKETRRPGPSPTYQNIDNSNWANKPVSIYNREDIGGARLALHQQTKDLPLAQRVKSRIAPWHVNVHQLGEAYGGREEGGWTYSTAELKDVKGGYVTKRKAERVASKINDKLPKDKLSILNMSPSDVYQMDQDQGVFEDQTYTDNWAMVNDVPSTFIQQPSDEDYDYSHFGKESRNFKASVSYGKLSDYPKRAPIYE